MRLGFVGVGRHAQRMARAFRECGAEVVAHARKVGTDCMLGPTFGECTTWQAMVTDPNIDAIVVAAPPDVTRQVAEALLGTGKPACLTKPFECGFVSEPWVIDFWRLHSPAWLALKAELAGRTIAAVHVDFYGNGPQRAFSGLLDYGPHALAFVLDLGLKPELVWANQDGPGVPETRWIANGDACCIVTGNGFASPMSGVRVDTTDGGRYLWFERDQMQTFEAGGAVLVQNWTDLALRGFCRAFLRGEPSDTLRISCEAMRLLKGAS